MNILLTLFLLSLSSITVMIGRKLLLIRKGHSISLEREEILFEIPYIREVKAVTSKNVKRYGYLGLVLVIRLYYRGVNSMRNGYKDTIVKIKTLVEKHKKIIPLDASEQQEISRFLKNISEYKSKIRKIKHKIKKEEGF